LPRRKVEVEAAAAEAAAAVEFMRAGEAADSVEAVEADSMEAVVVDYV
jgi:hypothetical protein